MITQYDPNVRWARHTIELTFMQWNYSAKMQTEVFGNVVGADLFEGAFIECFNDLYDAGYQNVAEIILKRSSEDGQGGEDTLEVTLDDEDDLKAMCVSICILKHVAEEQEASFQKAEDRLLATDGD